MDTGSNIAGAAMAAYQNQALAALKGTKTDAAGRAGAAGSGSVPASGPDKMDQAAKQFEGIMISQFLGSMFSGIKTDGPFGGGQGEEMFRSMMIDKYAEGITAQGGFGLAASIKAQMLKMQEAH